ncbi:MAG: DUF1684 domain-containing protein [Acidobacteria bacterium]|nr:MAG: DUF1684 domain-containing protein [Acidobacteriota bacterium]
MLASPLCTPAVLRLRSGCLCVALVAGVLAGCSSPPVADPDHVQEIEEWREARVKRLQSETGWLTLVGLHWLEPGENRFGTDKDNEVVLPEGTAPGLVGTFVLEDGRVRVRAESGVGLTLAEEPVTERPLASDHDGPPDILRVRDLHLYVIQRGERIGIRVKDSNSPVLRDFHGLDYFPVDTRYRMQLPFQRYESAREISIPSVLGTSEPSLALGFVEFELEGRQWTLVPVVSDADDRDLFFIFGDLTNGKETYGAGRFVYGELGDDDTVSLDFNKSYNPPCVFTPFATCPLPPPENRLTLRILAGERTYSAH